MFGSENAKVILIVLVELNSKLQILSRVLGKSGENQMNNTQSQAKHA